MGEKLEAEAFATLERQGSKGRANVSVVVWWKGAEKREWRGPKGRAEI